MSYGNRRERRDEADALLLLPPPPLLIRPLRTSHFFVGKKKGINRAKRISTPGISRLRIQAIPISDKRIIRKSEKLSTLRRPYPTRLRSIGEGRETRLTPPSPYLSPSFSFSLPVGDVSQTGKLDSDDRSPFPYGSRSGRKGGWRKVVAAKLIFERGATPRVRARARGGREGR